MGIGERLAVTRSEYGPLDGVVFQPKASNSNMNFQGGNEQRKIPDILRGFSLPDPMPEEAIQEEINHLRRDAAEKGLIDLAPGVLTELVQPQEVIPHIAA
jgi:hypothetical protein